MKEIIRDHRLQRTQRVQATIPTGVINVTHCAFRQTSLCSQMVIRPSLQVPVGAYTHHDIIDFHDHRPRVGNPFVATSRNTTNTAIEKSRYDAVVKPSYRTDAAATMTDAIEERRERVRAALAASGRSVNAVAEQAGMKEPSLRGFLSGKTRDMRIESYEALAPVLSVSPEWLIFGWQRQAVPDFDLLRDCLVAALELATGARVVGGVRDLTQLTVEAYQLALEDREAATAAGVRMAVRALARRTLSSPTDGS